MGGIPIAELCAAVESLTVITDTIVKMYTPWIDWYGKTTQI